MYRIALTAALFTALALGVQTTTARPLAQGAIEAIDEIAARSGVRPNVTGTRPSGLPKLVSGVLTQPSDRPAADIAREFVARWPGLFPVEADDLAIAKNTRHAAGRTVRFEQTHDGLPVIGATLAVYVRTDGVIRAVASSLTELGALDTTAKVEPTDAAREARASSSWILPAVDQFHSRLVVVALPGQGRLAWEIHFGALPGLLSNPWFYVDAKTGELIRKENRIVFQYQGRVFETNPGPYQGPYATPVEVDLDIPEGGFVYTTPEYEQDMIPTNACEYDAGVDAGDCDCPDGDCIWLSHPQHASMNCPDYHLTIPLDLSAFIPDFELDAHFCTETQTAFADAADQYFYEWEGDSWGLDDLNMNDKFAEVQMFHHVSGSYNYFMDLMDDHAQSGEYDWDGHDTMPLLATVNFKLPIDQAAMSGDPDMLEIMAQLADPYGEMFPFDNAFFMPGSEESVGIPGFSKPYDSIVFGQGSLIDFGWDGDVIRHEFTHSVDNSVAGSTSMFTNYGDEWGVNPEPGGLSEGFADIFPAFMSDEPTMGEYSLAAFGPGNVRDLSGDDVCPDALEGEVHADSPVWSQSVYQARDAAAGDDEEAKHKFEQAAFIGLSMFVPQTGFGETAANILTAVEDLLGADAAADAAEVFAAHSTDDCARVMSDGGDGELSKQAPLAAPATVNGGASTPFVPGIMQFMVTAAGDAEAVNLEFALATGGGGLMGDEGEAEMQVLVRVGEPIQFEYDGANVLVDDDVLGPLTMDSDNNFSLVAQDGGPLAQGEYYLMPVNVGDGAGTMAGITASAGDAIADEDGTHTYQGADDNQDAGPDAGPSAASDSSGCGCSLPGAGTGGNAAGLALLLLLLAGVILRAR